MPNKGAPEDRRFCFWLHPKGITIWTHRFFMTVLNSWDKAFSGQIFRERSMSQFGTFLKGQPLWQGVSLQNWGLVAFCSSQNWGLVMVAFPSRQRFPGLRPATSSKDPGGAEDFGGDRMQDGGRHQSRVAGASVGFGGSGRNCSSGRARGFDKVQEGHEALRIR